MNLVDLKYAGILSSRIDRFVVKSTSPYKANMRCPLCGDSKKSKSKARGWILERDNEAMYYCHNCNFSNGLRRFLETYNPSLHNEYVMDIAMEKSLVLSPTVLKPLDKLTAERPAFDKSAASLRKIKRISQLPVGHGARDYVLRRKIPTKEHYRIYFVPKFAKWVNSMIPDKLPAKSDAPRLILPFVDKGGKMFGFQGRAFDNNPLRYITIMLREGSPKIFGLDQIDFTKRYYVVEGPIDSLFIDNCVAMAGADGNSNGMYHEDNAVMVFDNEPRNPEIVSRMKRCLDRGLKVCIWPSSLESTGKDINDLVLAGIKGADVQLIIDHNTHSGLQGTLELNHWKRC